MRQHRSLEKPVVRHLTKFLNSTHCFNSMWGTGALGFIGGKKALVCKLQYDAIQAHVLDRAAIFISKSYN